MSDEAVAPPSPPPKEPFFKRIYTYFCVTTPKAAYFLLWNTALESFAGYGIVAVMMLYLKEELGLPEEISKTIYHVTQVVPVFLPVVGSILADLYLGKFFLIVPVDWVWMITYAILAVTSYTPIVSSKDIQRGFGIAGLMISKIRRLGTPSAVAFPGDQYDENAVKARDEFYHAFYFAVNGGSMLAYIITPKLRANIHCVPDSESCFTAVFGTCVGISLIASVILWAGFPFYKFLPPSRKQNWNLLKCLGYGIVRVIRCGFRHGRSHWLDLADDKYSEQDISDAKAVWELTILFTAYPMFWALFDQQATAWTMMSTKMDGRTVIGQVLPDQMDFANPCLVMILIVLFTTFVYPLCEKINFLKTPIERIWYGFVLAGICFILGGVLSLVIEWNMPGYPESGKTDIVFHNGLPCDLTANFNSEEFTISKYKSTQSSDVDVSSSSELNITVKLADGSCSLGNISTSNFVISAPGGYAYSVVFKMVNSTPILEQARQNRSRDNQMNAAKIRFIYIGNGTQGRGLVLDSPGLKVCYPIEDQFHDGLVYKSANLINDGTKLCYLSAADRIAAEEKAAEKPGSHCEASCKSHFETYVFARGGIYDVMVIEHDKDNTEISVFVTAEPDSIPILLQIPMYIIITAGEVMCSVTAYSLAYSESPEYTKSIMQSLLYVGISIGNLYVIIIDWITRAIVFSFQSEDPERPRDIPAPSVIFFVYAAFMALDVLYFTFLARRYKYVNVMYQNIKKTT